MILALLLLAAEPSAYPTEPPGACIVYACGRDSKASTGAKCECVTWARSRPPVSRPKPKPAKVEAPSVGFEGTP